MEATTNSLNWFEIPATDIDRSQKFFEAVFDLEMITHEMGDMKKAMFPMMLGSGKSNGEPSKVDSAGGKVVMSKTPIGENGSMATIIDIERNSVGIHSIE